MNEILMKKLSRTNSTLERGPYASEKERWSAVVRRDRSADGMFFYSVKTTGVYCRPSCGARRARRENVAFHSSIVDAERAGFRPCKRCQPNGQALQEQYADAVAKACRMIKSHEESPDLATLAKSIGMSRFHFHRVFRSIVGLTPKSYANANRANRVREEISKRATITEAIYGAGYNANSRFYEKSSEILGMQPTSFRKGGEGAIIRFAVGECSLGSVLVASSQKGVCAISLGDDPDVLVKELQDQFSKARLVGGDREFESVVSKVVGFIEQPRSKWELPLDVRGTVFQQRVWEALRGIPAGRILTYSELARLIGAPQSVRAVAGACAANKLAIAIPCHRVVRSDGDVSGYRWGVERKRKLLKREAA